METESYTPAQKERFSRDRLDSLRTVTGKYPDEECLSDDGHNFVSISTIKGSAGKLIGRFMCTECDTTATVELELDDVDEDPGGMDGDPIDR